MSNTILIADDHQMFAEGIQSLLESDPEISKVGIVNDGPQVIDYVSHHPTKLVLLDINMPGVDGVDTLKLLRSEHPDVKVIMLTMHNEYRFIEQIMLIGAHGYLLKNTGRKELLEAIKRVLGGGSHFGQEVMETYIKNLQQKNTSINPAHEVKLTKRETEILIEITNELTSTEIAEKLYLSPHTVESHRKNLLSKTGARNSVGLVKYAVQAGIIQG